MKRLILLIFISVLSLSGIELSAQTIDFKCDSKINFKTNYNFENKAIDTLLNQIDFENEDFEFRILSYFSGDGSCENVFLMKHFFKKNEWKVYYYHQTQLSQIQNRWYKNLPNGEIDFYDSNKLKEIWNSFVSNELLLISEPSTESVNKASNGVVCEDDADCRANIIFQLIKKGCIHICDFDPCQECYILPEFIRFNNILKVRDKVVRRQF